MSKHKMSAPGRARAGRGEYVARIKIFAQSLEARDFDVWKTAVRQELKVTVNGHMGEPFAVPKIKSRADIPEPSGAPVKTMRRSSRESPL
jgi:hypothetical protein